MGLESRNPEHVASELAVTIGPRKATMGGLNLLILGILGGAYIALGAQLSTVVSHDISQFVGLGFARLIAGSVFSVGLMLVVIGGAELFTGNSLMFLSVLNRNATVRRLLRNWGIVYFANLMGSLIVVLLVYWSGLWKLGNGAVGAAAMNTANAKVSLTFVEGFARGILCNWMVCLAIWLALAARTVIGKIAACFFPIMAFVASGFEHSIANMYFIPMGLMLKGLSLAEASPHLSFGGMILRNLIPVTLGNIVGGAVFVATLYWIVYVRKGRSTD